MKDGQHTKVPVERDDNSLLVKCLRQDRFISRILRPKIANLDDIVPSQREPKAQARPDAAIEEQLQEALSSVIISTRSPASV